MAREVLSNGVINPDKYQADWYADLSNNWHLLNNLIGSAISSSEVDSKIATAIQELMIRTFQIVAELPATGTEGVMYLVLIPNTSKYTAYVWENNAYRELGVIQMTITIDDELSTTSENPVQNKVITNALGGKANSSHTHSASDITSGLASVATSGSYNDLNNTPTIPTVNNATLTIQQNGVNVQTFTANASTNATANITVPTKTSDLTNDSGFITSDNTKIPLAGSNAISGSLIPATTNAYDLGSSSYQWNNAYIKSLTINGVACGDILTHNVSEFVDVTSAQTIGGTKTFSGLRTYFGRDISCYSTRKYGKNLNPTSNTYQYLNFSGNTVSDGTTNDWSSGYLEQVVDTNGGSRGRWFVQDTSENGTALEVWASGNDKQVRPLRNGDTDLGTTNRKWKSLNGINPGALSLPSNSYVDVDTTNWDLTCSNGQLGSFTPTADGWLMLQVNNGGTSEVNFWIIGGVIRINNKSTLNTSDNNNFNMITIPVEKDVTYNIYGNASEYVAGRTIGYCIFAPCQGNV